VQGNAELPALPDDLAALCETFRADPETRSDTGRGIFESDLGSRFAESEFDTSSVRRLLPPRIQLTRSQVIALLGEPTIRAGWIYSWLCGQSTERGWVGRDVYVLAITFNEDDVVTCCTYNQQKKSHWTKFARCVNEFYGLAGRPEMVLWGLQRALQKGDWESALRCCSERVCSLARGQEGLDEFFKRFTPLEELVAMTEFPTEGYGSRSDRIMVIRLATRLTQPDTERPVRWEWALERTGDKWRVDFKPITVENVIKKEVFRRQLENEDRAARVARFKQNIKYVLTPLSEHFVIGEPMLFRLEMKNTGDGPVLYTRTSFMVNDPMDVVGPDGSEIRYADVDYQTSVGPDVILAGETIVLMEQYDVTSQYSIVEPGRYTFRFRGRGLYPDIGSNVCTVDVSPGKLPAFEQVAERLSAVMPDGWMLQRRLAQDDSLDESSQVEYLFVHLIGKREGGKGGDRGVTLLVVMRRGVSAGDVPEKEWTERFEYWGMSEWGPLYAYPNAPDSLWPDYKNDIVRVLGVVSTPAP